MKKITVLAITAVFLIASAGSYACGDKDGSAKKVDASQAETKVVQASAKNTDANVETTQVNVITGECTPGSKAKAANSGCPAAKDCPASCNLKSKSAKAETGGNSGGLAMTSKSDEKNK